MGEGKHAEEEGLESIPGTSLRMLRASIAIRIHGKGSGMERRAILFWIKTEPT